MLKNILPILAIGNIKLSNNIIEKEICVYDTATDKIHFNRDNIIKDTEFKQILEFYLNKTLSKKEFLVFCLLHELGHRYRHKSGNSDIDLYWEERKRWELMRHNADRKYNAILYWNEIKEEQEAMNFAKHYFNIYLKNCNSLKDK